MSAPTWAIFYKEENPDMVSQCFVNTGWFYDESRVLKQIDEHLQNNDFDYDYFTVYGDVYHLNREEIQVRIVNLEVEKRTAFKTRMEKK